MVEEKKLTLKGANVIASQILAGERIEGEEVEIMISILQDTERDLWLSVAEIISGQVVTYTPEEATEIEMYKYDMIVDSMQFSYSKIWHKQRVEPFIKLFAEVLQDEIIIDQYAQQRFTKHLR